MTNQENNLSEEEIKRWLKERVTQFLLEKLAKELNELDTVRDLTAENHLEKLSDKKAILVIENLFMEFYKHIPKLQQEVAEKEFNIIKSLKDFKDTDY